MTKYTFKCDQGHEPMEMEVMAGSDEEAMGMMMDKYKAHLGEQHPDMAKSDDELKEMIMAGWQKSEGGEAAPADDQPAAL